MPITSNLMISQTPGGWSTQIVEADRDPHPVVVLGVNPSSSHLTTQCWPVRQCCDERRSYLTRLPVPPPGTLMIVRRLALPRAPSSVPDQPRRSIQQPTSSGRSVVRLHLSWLAVAPPVVRPCGGRGRTSCQNTLPESALIPEQRPPIPRRKPAHRSTGERDFVRPRVRPA